MSPLTRVLWTLLASTSALLLAMSSASAEHIVKKPCKAVAFLVNGFTGCCIPERIKQFLTEQDACVHVANWNQIDQKGHPGVPIASPVKWAWKMTPSPNEDQTFVKAMVETIKTDIDPATPLILIGHSFGGDAVLQVATKLDKQLPDRKIAFLAVLDGVGRGGLRKNITQPVPGNVEYFFNRWQQNVGSIASNPSGPMPEGHWIPFDRVLSGKIASEAAEDNQKRQSVERTKKCKAKTRKIKAIKNLLTHGGVPNDSCVQENMKTILLARIFAAP